ncbi:MAG: class I SAM-dependent methyltransferase [Betaproteobacteria bacterium HGW-Betaproteobacteria-12]|nr:MAG: class I SAM-dependent methyltransferase [Betaproteobacteria bacterium HGW-Betaproteobacteria-12]
MDFMISIIALTSALTLAAVVVMYFKLSAAIDRRAKAILNATENQFRQIEALLAVYKESDITHALPPTRGWAASPDFLRNLSILIGEKKPRTVVECSSGTSTLVVAACLKRLGEGHVYSLENDPEFAEKTRAALIRSGLSSWATVLDAPLKQTILDGWQGNWYSTDNLPPDLNIDLLCIDGPPGIFQPLARYPALPIFAQQLSTPAYVIMDDSERDDEKTTICRWKESFKYIETHHVPECEKGCTLLRIAGLK